MARRKKSTSGSPPTLDDAIRVLILHGKEDYLLRHYLEELRRNIEAKHAGVDVIHFDGERAEIAEVLDETRSFGLLAQYRIIVVDAADEFVKGDARRPMLERYAENPVEHATLVLRASTWRSGRLDKAVHKVGASIKCEVAKPDQAVEFCMSRCRDQHGTSITPDVANRLVERIGTDLSRLDSELSRLALFAAANEGITQQIVDEQVPLTREEQAWELQNAILGGGPAEGLAKVQELIEVARHGAPLLNFCLSDLARKLYSVAKLREEGASEQVIDGIFIRWDRAQHAIKKAASRKPASEWAALMAESMYSPMRTRVSLGDDARALEMLATRFVSTIYTVDR